MYINFYYKERYWRYFSQRRQWHIWQPIQQNFPPSVLFWLICETKSVAVQKNLKLEFRFIFFVLRIWRVSRRHPERLNMSMAERKAPAGGFNAPQLPLKQSFEPEAFTESSESIAKLKVYYALSIARKNSKLIIYIFFRMLFQRRHPVARSFWTRYGQSINCS